MLTDFRVVHLIDPARNSFHLCEHNAFAVFFFTSPTIANVEPYHLKNLLTFHQPQWLEMRECCKTMEKNFSKECYRNWAELCWMIWETSSGSSLRTVLESKKLCVLLLAKDESILSDNIIHNQWMLHRYPTHNYTNHTIHFPTDYVPNAIVEKLRSRVSFQLNIAEGNCVVLGELYENLVFTHLTKKNVLKYIILIEVNQIATRLLSVISVITLTEIPFVAALNLTTNTSNQQWTPYTDQKK